MEQLTLAEGAPPKAIPLPLSVAQAMAQSEVALVQPTLEPGIWQVAAARKVGAVKVGDLQVLIKPKIRIDRLIFLMGYSRDPNFWRDHQVQVDMEKELPEALAEAFTRQATRALEQGLLHGYIETEESLSVLRGRLRVGDQIARHHGRLIPLEVRFDEFTVDIAENRLLLAATLRLLRLPIPGRAPTLATAHSTAVVGRHSAGPRPAASRVAADAAQSPAPACVTTCGSCPCRQLF